MTVLADWEILDAIRLGKFRIDPFDPNLINPNSIDVRLGDECANYDGSTKIIDPYDHQSIMEGLMTRPIGVILPGEFLLASTVETVRLAPMICAELNGKSSIARLGVEIHITGGWIDAGFQGEITLEMHNVNSRPVRLYAGMPIGQLVIHEISPAKRHYGERKGSKYQDQSGPVASRYYLNNKVKN